MRNLIIYTFIVTSIKFCNHPNNLHNNTRNIDSINSANITNSTSESSLISMNRDTLSQDLGCYYKLDDKYSESEDTSEINLWWRKKLKEFEQNGFRNNLFADHGGGPNGAEWNSSTDLYIVASLNKILKEEWIELELNRKKVSGVKFFKYIPTNKTGTIIYCQLPKDLWKKNLRKINANDLNGIYGKSNVDTLKKNPTAPLETGQVVEINLKIKDNLGMSLSFTDFFHIAYGE